MHAEGEAITRRINCFNAGTYYQIAMKLLASFGAEVEEVKTPTSPSAGLKTRELIGMIMNLQNSRARLIESARKLNLGFAFGQFLYTIAGRNDVESLSWYNSNATKFSDDGMFLHGAYGPRIVSQLHNCIRLLKSDPGTRRAVITFFDGNVDYLTSKDIPCPVSMQFLHRNRRIECITVFRSQNHYMLFPYDIMLFTMLHEFVAVQTGLQPGVHMQFTASLHLYEREMPGVASVLGQPVRTHIMPPMVPVTQDDLFRIFEYEDKLRFSQTPESVIFDHLPAYWVWYLDVLKAFAIARRQGHEQLRDYSIIER